MYYIYLIKQNLLEANLAVAIYNIHNNKNVLVMQTLMSAYNRRQLTGFKKSKNYQ